MRKIFNNLIDKISLELAVLLVSISLVTGGFVYATWNQSQTNLADQYDQIDSAKWNSLVDQVVSDCVAAGNSNCGTDIVNSAKATSTGSTFYLTQQNWYNFIDVISRALTTCTCQIGSCNLWNQAKDPKGISRATWNVLANEIYKKCSGSSCWNNFNTAKISNVKLTKANWNGFANLLQFTIAACYNAASSSPTEENATSTETETETVPEVTPCPKDCEGKVCGDDGCGGSCGSCDGACNNGQCEDTTTGHAFQGPSTCNDYCTGLKGICNSVGTDVSGKNGYISSAVADKMGNLACSDIAGNCATTLTSRSLLCNGQNADWTYCNCTICADSWKQSCGQNLGDAACIKTGTIDCHGQCQGASLLPDGTDCSISSSSPAQCVSGKCISCNSKYDNLCGYNLGFLECINLGRYNCFGSCVGASRKDSGTVCGTSMTCNSSGVCEHCTPECTGKQCGQDSCGGTCGACETGKEVCNPVTGLCIPSTGYLMATGQTCDALCSSINGLCNSVGTDSDGKNGLVKSVTVDTKSGTETCADIAGQCSTAMGPHTSTCDGRQTDWAYCNCKICASNWKQLCGQELGDASCIGLGKSDCDGQCIGYSYKIAGTSCGTNLECDGAGKCATPASVLIKINTATGRSCSDVCQNNWNGRSCAGVGTNASADNGLIRSADVDAKSGAATCKDIAGDCNAVINSLGVGCEGTGAEWTYCKCSL